MDIRAHWQSLVAHPMGGWRNLGELALPTLAPTRRLLWCGIGGSLLPAETLVRAFGDAEAFRHWVPLASPELERLQRLQTILQIQAARLALLQRDGKTFHSELEGALGSLQTYFDAQDPAVQSARQQLETLRNIQIDPQRPDLSGSLAQLRALEAEMVMP